MIGGMSSRRTTPKQRAHWLAQFDQSNISAAAFCREHQLRYQSFLNWRRKAQSDEACPSPEFIKIDVPVAATTPINRESIVELTFPGGLLLRISPRPVDRT